MLLASFDKEIGAKRGGVMSYGRKEEVQQCKRKEEKEGANVCGLSGFESSQSQRQFSFAAHRYPRG